jgi:hypothetical protein
MFARFPKQRPPLPPEYEKIYSSFYKSNREGKTPASFFARRTERWIHKKIAQDLKKPKKSISTLEIGAGTLNHLPDEPSAAPYDIVEPFTYLYQSSPSLGRVRGIYKDISEISLSPLYDRILSITALEHILNLPEVVARCGLLLREEGTLRVAIPSEGELLWSLALKVTTGLEFKLKYNLDYGVLMRHEHVNTAREIHDILHYFFSTATHAYFGISNELSILQVIICSSPHRDRCEGYLQSVRRAAVKK